MVYYFPLVPHDPTVESEILGGVVQHNTLQAFGVGREFELEKSEKLRVHFLAVIPSS